jgi:hypothetical protein
MRLGIMGELKYWNMIIMVSGALSAMAEAEQQELMWEEVVVQGLAVLVE